MCCSGWRCHGLVLCLLAALLSTCATTGIVESDATPPDASTDGGDSDVDGDGDDDGDAPVDATACTPEDAAEVCDGAPCVDGYCCDEACEGLCRACDVRGSEGSCAFVPEASDPDDECAESPPASCGTNGLCDGQGGCALYGSDTGCDDGEECTTGDACDGEGGCRGTAPPGCEPGPGNQCCEVVCEGGCSTAAGTCEDRCTSRQLITGLACVGCGPPGAEGVCTGGAAHSCNEASHTLCEQIDCGGATYYCTNAGGVWEWRIAVACDDGDECTFGDACLGGTCTSTPFPCESDPCTTRACDGAGGCIETPLPATTTCGTEACPPDSCGAGSWSDYPAECTRSCDGSGTCETCACASTDSTCVVGASNECCEPACADASGCYTLPGPCGAADTCGATVLDVASVCEGCGPNGASGSCSGGATFQCSATSHTPCQVVSCGGATYYCTNLGGTWQWRASDPSCDDGDDCTYGDSCGGSGCAGTPISCVDTPCMVRSCNGTSACTEVPLTGTVCEDGDPCTYGERCTAAGVCPAGTPITCPDTDCVTRECNGTATCATTVHTGDGCNDGDPCTYGETCDAGGACGGGTTLSCDPMDWECMDYSCDGTSSCAETPINLGGACDDGDPLTDHDVCRADGSCAGTAGCPPPADSCVNGSQSRDRCSGARVIGRTVAATTGGYVISDDTCSASDRFDDSSSCWDANADHAYRIYMRAGESVYIRYETFDSCPWSDWWYWYGTLKIFENLGCDDLECRTKVFCDYNDDLHETTYTAPRDGWIIIVADGSSAFDDWGDYTLTVRLTCNVAGCEC